ncbi:hypothetical protein EC396_09885 [Lutibacter sp. HS1-25]|uniref:hypothetical protein n=1 Tax=Lutibacter sp. HS1-25 TaxID=2485000 RepID=UPI0010123B52|nr:hypothetical protein [Lutibacter sp. HS1-25]RXP53796.1 hypothetical protein EC396_09885 [Lutibacter sp. HS1-25]
MKLRYKIWLLIFGIIAIVIVSANIILNTIVTKVVKTEIENINSKGAIFLTLEKTEIDVFTSHLTLKGLHIKPDSLFFENFKLGKTPKAIASEFYLSELKIKGFDIFNILLSKEISVDKIIAKDIDLNIYKSDTYLNSKEAPKKSFDSIFIKGIEKIDISNIEFNNFKLTIINAQKIDTLFAYQEKSCLISGIAFNAYPNAENYFKFNKDSLQIQLKNQHIDLEKGNYDLFLEDILYDFPKKTIQVSNFKLKPKIDKFKLASTYKYNSEVYEVASKKIIFNGFYIDSIIKNGVIAIDSIDVDGLNLDIYKDQTKPFNKQKRPLYLNQKLKRLDQPIYIQKVLIKNSLFTYKEKHDITNELLTVTISDINANFNHITSIKDSLKNSKPLNIHILGKLNNVAHLNLTVFMPYNTWNNSFSFVGKLGGANFKEFNTAIYPATGVKFEEGKLHSMNFSVHGTPAGSKGEMTMLYSDIKIDILKEHKKMKTASWLGNTLMNNSNPSKNGKLRVGIIEFERVPYKGFGNLLWKSVMSGMVNTLNPIGKTEKEVKKKSRKKWFSKKR